MVGSKDDCRLCYLYHFLPTKRDGRGVLGVGSIPVAILPSCQCMKINALLLHKHEYSWVVKLRNNSEADRGPTALRAKVSMMAKDSIVAFNHAASSVFLIHFMFTCNMLWVLQTKYIISQYT